MKITETHFCLEQFLLRLHPVPFSSFHICSVFAQVLTLKLPADARTCSVVSEPAAALVNDPTPYLFCLLHLTGFLSCTLQFASCSWLFSLGVWFVDCFCSVIQTFVSNLCRVLSFFTVFHTDLEGERLIFFVLWKEIIKSFRHLHPDIWHLNLGFSPFLC